MTVDLTTAARMSPADVGIGRLFQDVRDAVIVADASAGRIVLWNPAAETVFGYTAQEAVGMPIEALVPGSLQPRHRAGLAHYNATGHGVIIDGRRVSRFPKSASPASRSSSSCPSVQLRAQTSRGGMR